MNADIFSAFAIKDKQRVKKEAQAPKITAVLQRE